MERDGARTRGKRTERQSVLQASRYRDQDILLQAAQIQRDRDQANTIRAREIGVSAGDCTVYRSDRICFRSGASKHRHQNIRHDRGDTSEYQSRGCRCRGIVFEAAMLDLSNINNYYIACGYTDLRRGIDGLAQIVTLQYGYEINENSLFLFCGRRTDRIQALCFSGDGFVLLYKRMNNGSFQWPRSKDELKLLTPQSFRWLMEGLTIEQKKVIKKCRQKDMF